LTSFLIPTITRIVVNLKTTIVSFVVITFRAIVFVVTSVQYSVVCHRFNRTLGFVVFFHNMYKLLVSNASSRQKFLPIKDLFFSCFSSLPPSAILRASVHSGCRRRILLQTKFVVEDDIIRLSSFVRVRDSVSFLSNSKYPFDCNGQQQQGLIERESLYSLACFCRTFG
jgi:hypothetical protein